MDTLYVGVFDSKYCVPEAKYVKYFNPNHIIAMGGSICTGGCKSDSHTITVTPWPAHLYNGLLSFLPR
jgi:hypothetical protein